MKCGGRVLAESLICGSVTLSVFLSACVVPASRGIDEEVLIDTGDAELFAEIRGRDREAPLLLYLHGGPGSPLGVPIFRAYGGRLLESRFIVVYLHQRGIMKSPRVPDHGHRVEQYVEDVHQVVEHLRRNFAGRETHLLGHSWGGVLAYLYLSKHPGAVGKLVAVSTPVDVESMARGRLERLLQWAEERENDEAIRDLLPLRGKNPIEHADEFRILDKWSPRAYGGWTRNLSRERIDAAIDYAASLPNWLGEQERIEELMREELVRIDLTDELESIEVPLLCIAGREDVNVPWEIIQQEMVSYAGTVEFELFENSHHMPFIDEEALFAETVIRFLSSRS